MKKVLLGIFIIILVFSILPLQQVEAVGDEIRAGDKFIEKGDKARLQINEGTLKDVSNFIYNVFLVIGVIVAVLIGAVLRNSIYGWKCRSKSKSEGQFNTICSRVYNDFWIFWNMEDSN